MRIAKTGGRIRSTSVLLASVAAITSMGTSALAGVSAYTLTDLGATDYSNSLSMNSSAEVVGTSGGQAVYATGGQPPLMLLGGSTPPPISSALGVNAGGVVVGQYQPTLSSSPQAFYAASSSAAFHALPGYFVTTGGAAVPNFASGVNGNGTNYEVVGQATYTSIITPAVRAFAWNSGAGALTPLDPVSGTGAPTDTGLGGGIAGSSLANGINSNGLIVGQATNSKALSVGFLYVPAQKKMYDLGSLGNDVDGNGDSNALAINTSGEIVGATDDVIASADYDPRAFIIKSGYSIPSANSSNGDQSLFTGPTGMIDIGTLPGGSYSTASAVNLGGLVVGWSSIDDTTTDDHAFVYDSSLGSPVMEDLNDPTIVSGIPAGWTLDMATGVNDSGDITGYATDNSVDGGGATYAFVLTPGSAVPEPGMGMYALAAAALASLGRPRRLRA